MPNRGGDDHYRGILFLANRSALLRSTGFDKGSMGGRNLHDYSKILITGFELIAKTKEWEELTLEAQQWKRELEECW